MWFLVSPKNKPKFCARKKCLKKQLQCMGDEDQAVDLNKQL